MSMSTATTTNTTTYTVSLLLTLHPVCPDILWKLVGGMFSALVGTAALVSYLGPPVPLQILGGLG
jgi:hypothetical protein